MSIPRLTKHFLGIAAFFAAIPAFAAEDSGVSLTAEPLFHLGPLPVSNSILASWIVAIGLLVIMRVVVRGSKLVPTRGQTVIETIVQGLQDLVTPTVGAKAIKASFPLLVMLFIFILCQNWLGLLPGVGTIVWLRHGEWRELIRPANADMNGTVALALVAIIAWIVIVLYYAGPIFILKDLFGNKADKREVPAFIYYPMFVVFFLVGILEVVSMLFRPVSLSFRLYGNVFGGENLIHSMSAISKWGLPIPFYFMEVLVGFVQALVFTLLVSVYIGLICNHDTGHEHDDKHGHDGPKEPEPAGH
jgi:F-type H+-transporting ATPase subunit a